MKKGKENNEIKMSLGVLLIIWFPVSLVIIGSLIFIINRNRYRLPTKDKIAILENILKTRRILSKKRDDVFHIGALCGKISLVHEINRYLWEYDEEIKDDEKFLLNIMEKYTKEE